MSKAVFPFPFWAEALMVYVTCWLKFDSNLLRRNQDLQEWSLCHCFNMPKNVNKARSVRRMSTPLHLSQAPVSHVEKLPDEILELTFTYLGVHDLLRCRFVRVLDCDRLSLLIS